MPPLQRLSTHQSALSWWPDNNPPGATIPLHTLAKPLLKLLHHRQAVAIVAKDAGASWPLSRDRVEVLVSYLRAKYIAVATKVHILQYLSARAESLVDAPRHTPWKCGGHRNAGFTPCADCVVGLQAVG
ncbi:hypothetical protein DFH09DRAFT_1375898 [Mycena vulgaris]|nr:hypothetical protein DFH09DRAFT_1375898 [Mycena vulgaris]